MKWDITWKGLPLTVRGTYHKGSRGSFQGGMQMEPDDPDCIAIDSLSPAGRPDVELMVYLNEAAVESIEQAILEVPEADEDDES